MLRLKRFTIDAYRCFRAVTVDVPSTGVAVLIGTNGAGKSTILDALDLVAKACRDDNGIAEAMAVRGPVADLTPWTAGGVLAPRFVCHVDGSPKGRFIYEINLDTSRSPVGVGDEFLWQQLGDEKPTLLMESVEKAARTRKGTMLAALRYQHPDAPKSGGLRATLAAGQTFGHFSTEPRWFLHPNERHDGTRAPATGAGALELDGRGQNLQTVLLTLKSEDTARWDLLVQDFSVAFPWVTSLDFRNAGGPQGLAARVRGERQLRLASDVLSDGMFCWLSILTAFALAESSGGVVAFDEPERGLHPELLSLFVGHAEIHGAKYGPVFIATHSDTLLDALEEPAESVITLTSGEEQPVLSKLNSENLKVWREKYRDVSSLRRMGLLGGKRM